jgi:hypothetical protein
VAEAGADVNDVDSLGRDAVTLAAQTAGEAAGAKVAAALEAVEVNQAQQRDKKVGGDRTEATKQEKLEKGGRRGRQDDQGDNAKQHNPPDVSNATSKNHTNQGSAHDLNWPWIALGFGGAAILAVVLMKNR